MSEKRVNSTRRMKRELLDREINTTPHKDIDVKNIEIKNHPTDLSAESTNNKPGSNEKLFPDLINIEI